MTNTIIVCAWCKARMKQSETWSDLVIKVLEREDAVISHGVCPACEAGLMQLLAVEAARRGMTWPQPAMQGA